MRRLLIALLIFTIANITLAQVDSGLYQAEDYSVFTYSGTGWFQLVDGDYVRMRSTDSGDSVSFQFTGSSIIIYRRLRPSGASVVDVCIDSVCTSVSNYAATARDDVPIAFVSTGNVATLTMTNTNGGVFTFNYVIVMPVEGTSSSGSGSELQTIYAPEPSMYYLSLESGRIVGIDFSISGGDIVIGVFLAFLSTIALANFVLDRWHHG